jgi:hypothetical protein
MVSFGSDSRCFACCIPPVVSLKTSSTTVKTKLLFFQEIYFYKYVHSSGVLTINEDRISRPDVTHSRLSSQTGGMRSAGLETLPYGIPNFILTAFAVTKLIIITV